MISKLKSPSKNNSILWVTYLLILTMNSCGKRAVQTKISEVPDWFLNPPKSINTLYAVATATSADLQLAINKAKQEARVDLASQVEAQVSALIKKFDEEVGQPGEGELLTMYSQATKTVVDQCLVGVTLKEQKILQEGNVFRVYILMELPLDAIRERLFEQIKSQKALYTRFRASQSFQELSEEVEKYRKFKEQQGIVR